MTKISGTSWRVLLRCLIPAALTGAVLAACSSDNGGGSTTPTLPASVSYAGLLVGNDGSTSTLNLVFNSAVSLQADGSGRMTIFSRPPVDFTGSISGSVPGSLTGTLDNGVFTATGDGYDLSGTLKNGQLTGSYDYNNVPSGGFVALSNTSNTPTTQYCGQYQGLDDQNVPESGTLNAVIAGKIIYGLVNVQQTATFDFEGSVNGTKIKVSQTIGPNNTKLVVDGDLTNGGQSVDGSYTTTTPGDGSSAGTFSADVSECSTGPSNPTDYKGLYFGGNGTETGALTFTLSNPAGGSVTGVLTTEFPTFGTATLTGNLTAQQQLTLSGGGFTFSLQLGFNGTYSHGSLVGAFYAAPDVATLHLFCGTYTIASQPPETGIADVVVDDATGEAGGAFARPDGTYALTNGTVNGNTVTFTDVSNPSLTLGTGTISGTTITGSLDFGFGAATFNGDGCP
jgi:hypothetical protein